jgi:hypothetical protein
MLIWCTICKSMHDNIYKISTHDNLGSVFAEKLQNNRDFLLFCLRTNCDSGFAQSSFMCSLFVYYCLSALFCPLTICSRIKAAECPFGNFILLKHIISDRHQSLLRSISCCNASFTINMEVIVVMIVWLLDLQLPV